MSTTYPDLYETKFPDAIDNWDRFLDPTIQTLSAITQYQKYYDQGDFEQANSVLESNPTLKRIIVNASSINKMLDGIIAIQRFYFSDFQTYLQNIIQLKGEWSSSIKYPKYSVVTYIIHDNTEAYLCLSNDCPIGTLPTDTNYWTPWTARGAKGDSGTGLTPRGMYSATADYLVNDLVSFNNTWWYAVKNNTGSQPSDSNSNWAALMKFSADLLIFDNSGTTLNSNTFQTALTELSNKHDDSMRLVTVKFGKDSWTGSNAPYVQTVSVPGIKETDEPIMVKYRESSLSVNEAKAYNKAFGILADGVGETADGNVTWTCIKKPVIDITIGLKGVSKNG